MDREAALELLNATHDFPCAFTLKVIGVAADDFELRVVSIVCESLQVDTVPFKTRETPKKKHVSVTLEPVLNSAEQVLEVYECIRAVEGVVMTM